VGSGWKSPPEICNRRGVIAVIEHYMGVFPDDEQVLSYVAQAIEIGMDAHVGSEVAVGDA
jgi:hypothetical protein